MLAEYDVDGATEFNRQQLGTTIKNRLRELLAIIDDSQEYLESWYAIIVVKLLTSVVRVCDDLLKTTEQDALPAAAWNARNLLELWVWTKYCSASRDNAWQFHQDALRDVQGLVESLSEMCQSAGVLDDFVASARTKIREVAVAELGVESVDLKFLRVADAAKSIGLENWFVPINRFLSKLAHPTAGLVVGIMHQGKSLRSLQSTVATFGLYFAGQCVIAMEEIVSAIPPSCA